MQDQVIRTRYRAHLVIFEGVTSAEADAFLDTMAEAGVQDPEGYAEFLAEMDDRISRASEALAVSSDLQRATALINSVIKTASDVNPTAARINQLQEELSKA